MIPTRAASLPTSHAPTNNYNYIQPSTPITTQQICRHTHCQRQLHIFVVAWALLAVLTRVWCLNPLTAKHLVFAGGGLRGWAYIGALQALRDLCGVDYGARRCAGLQTVAGTSIGAAVGLAVVLGFSVGDMATFFGRYTDSQVLSPNPGVFFTSARAADSGLQLRSLLRDMLFLKLGVSDVSLAGLRARTGLDFTAVVYDLQTTKSVYLSAATAPQVSTVEAVYASMAVPVLLSPMDVSVQPSAPLAAKHTCIDGGVEDNFPIERFPAGEVLGFRFNWTVEPVTEQAELEGTYALLLRALTCLMLATHRKEWMWLPPVYKARCISIDVGATPAFDATSSPAESMARRSRLIDMGYQQTAAVLRRRCSRLVAVK